MLNVLRSFNPRTPFNFEMRAALLVGALLALGGVAWVDLLASESLAALHLQKENLRLQVQSVTLSPSHTSTAHLNLQQSIRAQQHVLEALQKQQQMRDDLAIVQDLLFVNRLESNGTPIQLQHLLWQNGALEWEGSTSTPEALQNMLLKLSLFPRWQMAPGLVQIQTLKESVVLAASAPMAPFINLIPPTQHAFKFTGRLEGGMPFLATNEVTP
jgi:hypothetical protein